MRLEKQQIQVLKDTLASLSSEAELYLFGSRVDDNKRGGDIDLLVISDKLTREDIRTLRLAFFEYFGEQKLDIVLDDGTMKDPFVKHISQEAILL
ncbi:MAG: DNA polymerase III subunit beta [Gammaproteobacteria bacterium]|nr:MAG: DNA polymerase III subunit beta [Gammaproteobacteria bacterium]